MGADGKTPTNFKGAGKSTGKMFLYLGLHSLLFPTLNSRLWFSGAQCSGSVDQINGTGLVCRLACTASAWPRTAGLGPVLPLHRDWALGPHSTPACPDRVHPIQHTKPTELLLCLGLWQQSPIFGPVGSPVWMTWSWGLDLARGPSTSGIEGWEEKVLDFRYVLVNWNGALYLLAFEVLQDVVALAGFTQDEIAIFPGFLHGGKFVLPVSKAQRSKNCQGISRVWLICTYCTWEVKSWGGGDLMKKPCLQTSSSWQGMIWFPTNQREMRGTVMQFDGN